MCLGIPGEVTDVWERDGLPFGTVRSGDVQREVCLARQTNVHAGDFVLVRGGLAIAKIDRHAAARAWAMLEALGQIAAVTDDVAAGAAVATAAAALADANPRP